MKALILAAALVVQNVSAYGMDITMHEDPTNASWCYKPDAKSHWNVEIEPGRIKMWTRTEIREEHVIHVSSDGSFDTTIEMLSANTFSSRVRVWGNVNTHEFNSHNFRRFCKYHGNW